MSAVLKIILFFIFINNATAFTKPDVIFIYWDSATIPSDGKPITINKEILSQFGLKDLSFDSVLSRGVDNPESYTLLDYLKENPEDYKEDKAIYDSIFTNGILKGSFDSVKSGVIFSMVTAAEKKINQVILVEKQEEAQNIVLQAKNILGYFDDIYKELDVPNNLLPTSNMIEIDTTTANTKYNKCWLIGSNNNELYNGIKSGCIVFFVGDIKTLDNFYKQMIKKNQIIQIDFDELNKILYTIKT